MYVGPKDRPRRKDSRRDGRRKIYVGMDLHKDSLQMAIVDSRGRVESNSKIPNTFGDIDGFFSDIPRSSGIVMEASSVSEEIFLRLRDSGFKPVLANPFRTKAIAHAKIKTDKIDAEVLAQMLRGGFIPYCHMPSRDILDMRHLIRHRKHMAADHRTLRRRIHAILLAGGIRIDGKPFSKGYVRTLRDLGDYRIDDCLDIMGTMDTCIGRADRAIRDQIERWPDDAPRLLLTIPGIGPYTAMLIVSEVGDISRFPHSDSLVSYAGLVPSTHSSGNTTYHGHITKRGSEHLRTALVASVQSHRIGDPDGSLSAFYSRIAAKHGNAKAMVATASKLLRVAYWVLKERREYLREPPESGSRRDSGGHSGDSGGSETDSGRDSGRDSGTDSRRDSGTDSRRDSGTDSRTDSGTA